MSRLVTSWAAFSIAAAASVNAKDYSFLFSSSEEILRQAREASERADERRLPIEKKIKELDGRLRHRMYIEDVLAARRSKDCEEIRPSSRTCADQEIATAKLNKRALLERHLSVTSPLRQDVDQTHAAEAMTLRSLLTQRAIVELFEMAEQLQNEGEFHILEDPEVQFLTENPSGTLLSPLNDSEDLNQVLRLPLQVSNYAARKITLHLEKNSHIAFRWVAIVLGNPNWNARALQNALGHDDVFTGKKRDLRRALLEGRSVGLSVEKGQSMRSLHVEKSVGIYVSTLAPSDGNAVGPLPKPTPRRKDAPAFY